MEAFDFFEHQVHRSDMFRDCIMEQASKWAAITHEEIGVASHPHFMNPRVTTSQTGMVVPDAIRIMRETKVKEKKNLRERREAAKKRKADVARKARAAAKKASRPRKMTPSEAGRHGAWCKKMQSWGAIKKSVGFDMF